MERATQAAAHGLRRCAGGERISFGLKRREAVPARTSSINLSLVQILPASMKIELDEFREQDKESIDAGANRDTQMDRGRV